MAEATVSFVLKQLYQLASEESSLLKGVGSGLLEIKAELEGITAFLKDADRRSGEESCTNALITWVKQLREVSFRIEDVIDEYSMDVARYHRKASHQKIVYQTKTLKSRHRIASEIQNIKISVQGIRGRYGVFGLQPSSNFREVEHVNFSDPRMAPHFQKNDEVVGFESSSNELICCLKEEVEELSVITLHGMGGLGKTTLAKLVYDQVKDHFNCSSFIIVSQSHTVRELLMGMIKSFCKDSNEPLPEGLQEENDEAFVRKVRQYLQSKQYFVVFDDVWDNKYSHAIKYALPDNKKGSRIIVTTRKTDVSECFENLFPSNRIHHLELLPPEKARELFCKKAFRSEQCPAEFQDMSEKIVEKCEGLPLAIVAIGGNLSTKETLIEWKKVYADLNHEIDRLSCFTPLNRILSLSYDDLPPHLKLCMLYFGMYPKDYSINCKRLTRQWMAEGFVKNEGTKPIEEIAENYLKDLIHRSLVKVSRDGFNGKVKSCQVHDLLRRVIKKKMEDLSFCHIMQEDDELVEVGTTRRFSIATCSNIVLRETRKSGIRAIFVFDKNGLPEYCVDKLSAKFKLLKVLDFESTLLNYVPDNLGNLFHLRYLNLSHTKVEALPRSIGKLLNLETLDLRQTNVRELPKEIKNLTKLRLLPVYYKKNEGQSSALDFTIGVKMQKGVGCLKSLQKLYLLEADHGGLDLIKELKMLKQLRKLGIRRVKTEYAAELSTAIGEMNHLESLNVSAIAEDEIIDLNFVLSDPPELQVLNLNARVTGLPDWIPQLVYLVKLRLGFSNLQEDPLDSLKDLPNLLQLSMWDDAFAGENLHFKEGGFPKLKKLDFTRLSRLNSVLIDESALVGLESLSFKDNPQMKEVPHGLKHLVKLQFLGFANMATELVERIDTRKGGQDYWVIEHVGQIFIQ